MTSRSRGRAREAYAHRGSAGPCLGPADESSSARLSRALRGTAVEGAVPPQMGPYHRSSRGRTARASALRPLRAILGRVTDLNAARRLVDAASRIVVLTGAGIST